MRLIMLFLIFIPFVALEANSADVNIVSYRFSANKPVPHIHIQGTIWKGDVAKLDAAVERALGCPADQCSFEVSGSRLVVSLESPGGSLVEGIEMAEFFRSNLIATVVQTDDSCLSACALAFLGGTGFWPTGGVGTFIDRTIEPSAKLGFHSPFFPGSKVKEIVAAEQVSQALDLTRIGIAKFVGFLTKSKVNPLVIDSIIEMGEDNFYFVDTAERLMYTRSALPTFPAGLLDETFDEKIENVCLRLVSSFYNFQFMNGYAALEYGVEIPVAFDNEEQPVFGYEIDDRPVTLSHCASQSDPRTGEALTSASLYRMEDDAIAPFMTFSSSDDGGWSGISADGQNSWYVLGSLNQFFLAPDTEISTLGGSIRAAIDKDKYTISSLEIASRKKSIGLDPAYQGSSSRVWYVGDATIVERVGTAQLVTDLGAEADVSNIDLALSKDFPNAFVRSGTYLDTGKTFYWAGFQKGDAGLVIRVEYGHPAKQITKSENELTTLLACSTDFKGVHLPCYK